MFGIKNLEDLKNFVRMVGADNLKTSAPMLAGLALGLMPPDIKFKDKALAQTQLTSLIISIIDVVDNLE